MSEYLPKEVREGLERAHKLAQKKKSRLCVRVGEESFAILRSWDSGFAMDAEAAPNLRGLVDLYDGGKHLYQALIVASSQEGHEVVFEFKRSTMANHRPPVDFERRSDEPVALLPKH